MKIFSYIVIFILLVVGVTFALLNATPVNFHYYIGVKEIPLSILLVLSLVLGMLITFVVMSFSVLRLKAQKRGLNKRLKMTEKEIDNLRALPTKD